MAAEKKTKTDKQRIRYCSGWLAAGAVIFALLTAAQTLLEKYIPVENEAIKEVIVYIPGMLILMLLFYFILRGAKKRWPESVAKASIYPSRKVHPLVFISGIFIILGFGLAGNLIGSAVFAFLPQTDTSSMQGMFTTENFIWIFISYAIFPPLLEEMMCRAFTSRMLQGCGTLVACLIAGIPFALMHTSVDSFLGNLIFGMLAGYFAYTYQNVWMGVIAHLLNNGFVVIIMIVAGENGELPFYVVSGIFIVLAILGALYLIISKKVVFEKNTTECAHPVRAAFAEPIMIIFIVLTVAITVLTIISPGTV